MGPTGFAPVEVRPTGDPWSLSTSGSRAAFNVFRRVVGAPAAK